MTTNGTTQDRRLVAALGFSVLAVAVLQTGVVPVLSAIAGQLQVSTAAASWVVTANLLAAAASAPVIGRLADVFNKKSVLLGTLAVVLAGSILGATASALPLLVLGRFLQGTSFALYPIAVSVLRKEIPGSLLIRSIAVLSAMLGLGGAVGLVGTGFLMPEGASYQRIFLMHTMLVIAVIAAVVVAVPSRPQRTIARVDWIGAAGLALGLVGLLLAISQGSTWGWTSPRTSGAAAAGVSILMMWRSWNRRSDSPLVATAILKRRPVLLANSAGFLTGMGSYLSVMGLSHFAGCPVSAGFGFGASVSGVSLQFLLPGAITGTLTAVVAGRAIERFGARAVVAAGGTAGVVGFGMLMLFHTDRWQLVVAGLLTSAYISLSYGALPALIVGDVEPGETAVATGLNGTFSKIAGASAAALVGSFLTPAGGGHPAESGFTMVFLAGVITAAGVVGLAWLGRTRQSAGVRLLRMVPARQLQPA